MITYETIKEAHEFLAKEWGKDGENVITAIHNIEHSPMSSKEFLTHCTACGGNWGGMLLSGIRKLYPSVWEAIPNDMGIYAWSCICCVITLLGVDCSK